MDEELKGVIEALRTLAACIQRRGRYVYTRDSDGKWAEVAEETSEAWAEACDLLEIYDEE